jgi:signal transduction histidine kinase
LFDFLSLQFFSHFGRNFDILNKSICFLVCYMPTETKLKHSATWLSAAPLLEQCRSMCVAGQFGELPGLLALITHDQLNPEQAILHEVLTLYPGVAKTDYTDSQKLQRLLNLMELARVLSSSLAQAWIWELLQLIQINLHLHHAALHSTAMAVEMFEDCERKHDALSMQVSRCTVMIHCEMYREVVEMSTEILRNREMLAPVALCNMLRSTASAYYFLGNEMEGGEATASWQKSLSLHEECLQIAQANELKRFILISNTNISVLNASLGNRDATAFYLAQVNGLAKDASVISGSWPYWVRFCEILLQCQGADYEQGWGALLELAHELNDQDLVTAPVQDAILRKIVVYGKQWGHLEIALEASQRHVDLNKRRRRLLSKTLGDTVEDVMSIPKLLQKNQELSQQGHQLEASLARRNMELSEALIELRAEAQIRLDAESALQQAHDNLENEVRLRTAELESAMQVVMRQEKQLALGRLVVGVSHELNTPIGNATIASSTMQYHCDNLLNELKGSSLSRSKLQTTLHALAEGNQLLQRSLETASALVQRFRTLAVEQHSEELVKFGVSTLCENIIKDWRLKYASLQVVIDCELTPDIVQMGYPSALYQVLDQLAENAIRHGLNNIEHGKITLRLTQEGQDLKLAVSDNGVGISEEHVSRLFEPFFSKQLGQGGMGLGLSIVHSLIIDLMGGNIAIENLVPQGTMFAITIPVRCAQKQVSAPKH